MQVPGPLYLGPYSVRILLVSHVLIDGILQRFELALK